MTTLTIEEANIILDEGGIISCGGYTYIGRQHYLAAGTFPGCMRGGEIKLRLDDGRQWKQLNLRQLIEKVGFYPCPWTMLRAMILQCKDKSVNFEHMVEFCVNAPISAIQLKDPQISSIIWRGYFKALEE